MNQDIQEILDDIYINVCRLCKSSTDDCSVCRFIKICADVLDYLEENK